MAERLGSGSPRRLCPAAPRTIPPGSAPASAPGMPRGVRGAGSGAAAVLRGAGCRLLPSAWVPVVSRGRGDPAEVIGERPTEPSWMPGAGRIRKRWGGRPGRFAPGTRAPSPIALPPSSSSLTPVLRCVSQSPASQTTAPGPGPALSLTEVLASPVLPAQPEPVPVPLPGGCWPHPAPQPLRSPVAPIQHHHHAQCHGASPLWPGAVPRAPVAMGVGVTAGASVWDADGPAGSPPHQAGRGAVP